MQPELQIRLLDEFRVLAGGEPVTTLNTPRLQALLAYLLLHRDAPQPRQHIAFLFWPDSSEEQAQTNLRNLLLLMRRAFPNAERHILIERRTLQWREDSCFSLDVIEFERALSNVRLDAASRRQVDDPSTSISPQLQTAVDLYTGDLLPACYDEWILAPRERLKQGFLEALTRLVEALEEEGNPHSAALYAQRLLRHDPLQEENYRRLMRLHLGMADRAGVVNVYRQCERVMRSELGVEPSDVTRALLRRVDELSGEEGDDYKGPRAKGKGRARVQGNLPAQTAAFIGREREVAQLSEQLRHSARRLVTLTGTAGTGKTRLALQVALGLDNIRDGIFFVSLAPLTEPEMVERSIAQALGVTESANRPLRDSLLQALRDKHTLLVLDNFEHLLPAATLVAELLASCPQLKVLATSRAPLNLRGEHEYAVPPMTAPSRDARPEPDDLVQYEAVALFVERALEVSPHFALTRENARAVAEICRRLEGLPLAIELAAVHVKALSPGAILSRLDRRLKLLVGGKADLPSRQQALETAIEWSYNLLDEEEKRLFRGLSVFAGGWQLEAVEAIFGAEENDPERPFLLSRQDVVNVITSLLNKSLLLRTLPSSAEDRFSMLETLREYAGDRLLETVEAEIVRRRHALYHLELADASAGAVWGSDEAARLEDRLEAEQDNMRAALRWACSIGDVELSLRLSASLTHFWDLRGYLDEGRSWLQAALNLQPQAASPTRAHALWRAGMLANRQRDQAAARPLLEESSNMYKAAGDKENVVKVLNALAVMSTDSDHERALEYHAESLALRRDLGDKSKIAATLHNISLIKMHQGKWAEASTLSLESQALYRELNAALGVAYTHYVLGNVAVGQGDYAAGLNELQECFNVSRQMKSNIMVAWTLSDMAEAYYRQEEYERADALLTEARTMFLEMGDTLGLATVLVQLGRDASRRAAYADAGALYKGALAHVLELDNHRLTGSCLAGFAGIALAKGRPGEAVMLFGCAQAQLAVVSSSLERRAMTLGLDEARAALGEEAWQVAWHEGHAMPWQQAVDLALSLT